MNQSHKEYQDKTRTPKFDLNKVDYEWIQKNRNLKELKLAYEELEYDGYYPDLLKKCGERICELDPTFARRVLPEKKISPEEKRALESDLFDFTDEMKKMDQQLRTLASEDQENMSIFSNNGAPASKEPKKPSGLIEELEKKRIAENERLKGNECVKSKDFKEAVTCYSRSIELDSTEAFTFANRAMAYLKLKEYSKCIDDATKAINMKPGYLKAYHRRGMAYKALNKHEQAISDFQLILEHEPENEGVNKDLKETRTALNEALSKKAPVSEKPAAKAEKTEPVKEEKKKFVRVAIEEDEEDDEEPTITEVNAKKEEVVKTIASKFPLKNNKEIEAHTREAKMLMKKGAEAFLQKFEAANSKTGVATPDTSKKVDEKNVEHKNDEEELEELKRQKEKLEKEAE